MSAPVVRLGIRVRAGRAETALADLLPILGAGAEERAVDGDVEFSLYAPTGELPPPERIRALAGDAVVAVTTEPVRSDWERRWHEFLGPVHVGPLVVRPPWVAGAADDIVVDPGTSFGAGTHPTTRLCLRLLLDAVPGAGGVSDRHGRRAVPGAGGVSDRHGRQAVPRAGVTGSDGRGWGGAALCDWGTGSGVLAIAAARLGFAPVTAVDDDPGALEITRANAAANGAAITTVALDLAAAPAPWAPTVVANLPLEVLLAAAAVLGRPPRRLLASGFLRERADEVVAAFELPEVARIHEGEWAAVVLG